MKTIVITKAREGGSSPVRKEAEEQKAKRVQVLLSTYNGEKFLAQQLDSLLAQTHRPLEILVRDDGSTDSTLSILADYAQRGQLTYLTGKNLGVVGSFLALCRLADPSCDYFAFSDQDDYWEPPKIQKALAYLDQGNPALPLAYGSQLKIVDENLNLLRERYDKPIRKICFSNALLENILTGCTTVFNDPLRRHLASLVQTEDFFMHDWLVYLIASSLGQVFYDREAYLLYRQHGHNVLGARTGFWKKAKHQWQQLQTYMQTDLIYKNSAAFYQAFESHLSEEFRSLLAFYLKKNKTLGERFRLAFGSGLFRQRFLDDLVFKLLMVFGFL